MSLFGPKYLGWCFNSNLIHMCWQVDHLRGICEVFMSSLLAVSFLHLVWLTAIFCWGGKSPSRDLVWFWKDIFIPRTIVYHSCFFPTQPSYQLQTTKNYPKLSPPLVSSLDPTHATSPWNSRYWLRQRGLPMGSEGGLPSFAWAYSVPRCVKLPSVTVALVVWKVPGGLLAKPKELQGTEVVFNRFWLLFKTLCWRF